MARGEHLPPASDPPTQPGGRMTQDERAERDTQAPEGRSGFRDSMRRVQETGFDPVEVAGSAWSATLAGWRRAPGFVRRPIVVITTTFKTYSANHCNIYAAAIAYHSLFSVIPLLIVTLAVFGLVVSEDRVVEFIYDQFPLEESEDVSQTLSEIVRTTKNLSGAALAIGIVTLAWSASGVFSAIRQGLNTVSHGKRGHNFFKGKAIDVALVPVLGAVVFAALIANAVTQVALNSLARWEAIGDYRNTMWTVGSMAVAAVITFWFFLLLYRFVPSMRPSWKQAAVGALLATVLFEIVRNVAALIIAATPFDGSGALYASLATALAFLYVMRIVGSVLLLGAVFGRVVAGPAANDGDELADDAVPGV